MIIIDDKILVSEEVLEAQFLCNLEACKGACCWEGDAGAPLEAAEIPILSQIYESVKPFLRPEGIAAIEVQGTHTFFDGDAGTPLIDNGACVYMTFNERGIAQCGIEQAYKAGATDFRKPVSCHLYPIRVSKLGACDALNYERWDICSAACKAGKAAQLPVFRFVKEALIRKYGQGVYEELEAVASDWKA